MRLRFALIAFFCIAATSIIFGQTDAREQATGAQAAATMADATSPASATCTDLRLVPAARECTAVATIAIADLGFFVTALNSAEDGFTAEDLIEQSLGKRSVHKDAPFIRLERAETEEAKALLAAHHLTFDAEMHDEGYVIVPDDKGGLAVIAETAQGIFYGAQTVKQLVRGTGKDAVLLAPTLRDWPAMAHRGLSDDWSRGPLPNMEFLKREIRTLAAYKYNILSPYFEHTFAYEGTPVAAFPGGAMTPDEAREMVEYAAKYHITIIPEQESFGHLHHVLKFEQYSPLAENKHSAVLAPGDEGTLPVIAGWFSELAKIFPGPWAHVGADETFELGLGRTRAAVADRGLGAVYIDFLTQIHKTLEPNHKQLLFWGDIAEHSPDLVKTLPKDMIAVPWEYDAKPSFTDIIVPFTNAGLETWVAPGVNNWNRVYPNNNEALGNIRAFVRDGQKLGSKGMMNTVWNDDGEGIFDENWYGILFGAAAGWQVGESSEEAFKDCYGWAFHRDPTGKIDDAQRAVMAAHALLKVAGLTDAQDSLFWVDPLSADGQKTAAKIRPALSELRMDAERAITLVAEARGAAKADGRTLENPEAIDALELGARRIDFIGLKFQEMDEAIAIFNEARAMADANTRTKEISAMIENVGSNNGKIEDMRDGYTELGELYKRAWLRDNRPYWLDNNLRRYDRAAELWIGRADRWQSQVVQQWWDTKTLPLPEQVGFPAVDQAGSMLGGFPR